MALRGNDWQQLQSTAASTAAAQNDPVIAQAEAVPGVEGEIEAPRVPTKKQMQKMKRFDQAISRDAGDILQTIEVKQLIPVSQSVSWDEDPELLCSYNWQASTDRTNTIFGEEQSPFGIPHALCRFQV